MRKEVKIGLTIMAGVLTLYLVVTWVKSLHLFARNRAEYMVRVDDISGLKAGDPVNVFGYTSGNVESIGIDATGAIVTINLSEDVELKSDASAIIQVKELMGGKMLAIDPGKSPIPLAEGQIIPGTAALDFQTALVRAGDFMDNFDANRIDSMLININEVAKTFADIGRDLDSAGTGDLVDHLSSSAKSLDNILTRTEQLQLVDKLNNSLDKLDLLATKADSSLGSISRLADRMGDKTLPLADSVLTQVNDMLDDADEMVVTLKDLMKQMQDRNTLAGRILYDPELNRQFDETLENFNITLDHIRTKKIYVTMTLGKKQKQFKEKPVKVDGERVKKKKGEE